MAMRHAWAKRLDTSALLTLMQQTSVSPRHPTPGHPRVFSQLPTHCLAFLLGQASLAGFLKTFRDDTR